MPVRDHMISILQSSEAGRIRFSFTGVAAGMNLGVNISIDGSVFRQVARSLASGHLHVVEGHRFPGENQNRMVYSARIDTANGFEANTFYLGGTPRYSRDFNGLVVHESVHAYYDLERRTLPWIDNEAAAYIAQAWYLRNSGYAQSRIAIGTPLRVASLYVGDSAAGGDVTPLLEGIRNSLRNNPDYENYIGGTFTGDN